MNHSKDQIWISNHEIHKKARLKINDFLTRINSVEALRALWSIEFSFYPTRKEEYDMNLKLWDYLNKNRNSLNGRYIVFNVGFPESLYNYLRHTRRNKVMNPVILGIAALYALEPEKRTIIEEQIYPPIFSKAKDIAEKYFNNIMNLDDTDTDEERSESGYYLRYWQNVRDSFDKAFREYVGNSAIFSLIDPVNRSKRYEMAIYEKSDFDIKLPIAYMKDSDWERVVVKSEFDNLERSESNRELFMKWKKDLPKFHSSIKPEEVFGM